MKKLSLQNRIFIGSVAIAVLSLLVLWFVVRPIYERRVLSERITIIQQVEAYTVETLEKQIAMWIQATRGISLHLQEQPKDGEQFIYHTMLLHPEIIRIRIYSQDLPDKLESQNTQYSLTIPDSVDNFLLPSSDSLVSVGWIPQSSVVVTRSKSYLAGTTFYTAIWWHAPDFHSVLQRLPLGEEYRVMLASDSCLLYASCDTAMMKYFCSGETHVNSLQKVKIGKQKWYGMASMFRTVPLKFIVVVPESEVRAPVRELLLHSSVFVLSLFVILLIAGWILSYQISKPIIRLAEDVEKLGSLDFSQPIREVGMKNLQRMAETIELMRQSLQRYQQLNVERIIVEEWKNKLFMMHSDDLIGLTDAEGKFVFRNARFDELCTTLMPEGEIVSKEEFLSRPEISKSKESVEEDIQDRNVIESRQVELKIHLPNDEVHYYRLNDSIISRDAHPLGSLLILHDLTNDRIIDKMKSEMMNVIVHEMRSPVGSIVGFAELLSHDEDVTPEERREFLQYILQGGNHLLALINRFLDISRLESRSVEYPKAPTDIVALVQSVIEMLEPQLRGKNLTVEVEIRGAIPYATVVPDLIREAVMNLVTNAIKYGDQNRSILVQLSFENGAIIFSITDHGYGIPLEAQEKLFTKFYRVRSNKKGTEEVGTGLGLAYVKEIVTYHGGTISLESNSEIGCKFTISLPVESDHDNAKNE
ncbi:MAG TPA: ATP-binding protein [Bacteroidota bacterium]|nr:ATP-binding protein [Bacteroidota bacterium]